MKSSRSFHFVVLFFFLVQSGCGLIAPSHHKTSDYTPVFADASAGNTETVKSAIETDPTVIEARGWEDETLLHVAVQQNHKDLAELLLDKRADVNALTSDHLTPLHMAAQNGNLEIIQLLLSRKAAINALDSKGWTPLDRARKWRHPEAADLLVKEGGHGITEQSFRSGPVLTNPLARSAGGALERTVGIPQRRPTTR